MIENLSKAVPTSVAESRPGGLVLSAEGLSKRYGAVQALNNVSLSLRRGEIHALVGENGSGKSTLVGILSGTVRRDAGAVEVDGISLEVARPAASQGRGVVTVFQDGSLINELSVAQNLYLGTSGQHRPSYSGMRKWAEHLLADYGFGVDPSVKAGELPPGDRQLVEIIRAVASNPRILILDEATSALDAQGVDAVLKLMERVAARGSAVLFVTHRLSEVMRAAHSVTVLRDGTFQGTYGAESVTSARLVELMAGTRVDMEFPDRGTSPGPVTLSAKGLSGPGFGPVDIELHGGEIIGIAGADGNGQLPLLRGLAAMAETDGELQSDGKALRSYSAAVRRGVVYLSSDRKTESLFNPLSIAENLGIGVLGRLSSVGFMRLKSERAFVDSAVERYTIRIGNTQQSPSELSGGNQQKVALARVLAMAPKIVLIDEPTQGVDVRSRLDIYRFLRAIADQGSTVVVVSSDASELAGLSDRILVMSRGRITSEIRGEGATEEAIIEAFAVEHVEGADEERMAERATIDPAASSLAPSWTTQSAPEVEPAANQPKPPRRRSPEKRISLGLDASRLLALIVLIVGLALIAQAQTGRFLSPNNVYNIGLLMLPLAGAAAAQYFALIIGGIDVSVGAVMTLSVVVMSSWAETGGNIVVLLVGLAVAGMLGLAVGGVNALFAERAKIPPVIATIASMGMASGVAYILRPSPGGLISPALANELMFARLGPLPVALVVLVIVLAMADVWLRRTSFGLRLRAVGLNGRFAERLGIRVGLTRAVCYLVAATLAGAAGVILAAQVGIGDPNSGGSYTLLSIAAAILGGAALSGGRGTLIGASLGAGVLALSQSLVTALSLSDGTSFLFAGGLTLLALMSSREVITRLGRWLPRRRGTSRAH